jgi:hypothetical protein
MLGFEDQLGHSQQHLMEPLVEVEVEEEEEEQGTYPETDKLVSTLISNGALLESLTSLHPAAFNILVSEHTQTLEMRRTKSVSHAQNTNSHPKPSSFLSFFWLSHYPSIQVLSFIFKICPQMLTRFLQQVTVTPTKKLKDEI